MSLLPLYKKINKDISVGEDLKKKDYGLKPLDLNLGKLRPREVKGLAMVIQLLMGPGLLITSLVFTPTLLMPPILVDMGGSLPEKACSRETQAVTQL